MNVNDPRWASIDAFVEENRDNILRDITRLVDVPSVEGAPEPGAPFGPGPKAALAKALEIADELGLDTFNADSYIGWAETGRIADGQKFLATITHTDVVPEGNGWDADPYTVRVRDGWLLGRGVADDKGPSILCLYALKYLKDSGAALKYPVRALLGANEETNMHDVDYYAEHYPMPAFCFTPDAEFPVCNGEKGGFNGELVSPKFENGVITAFEGGVAHNAVPDRASCTVQVGAGALVQTEGVTFEAGEGGATVIRGWGKSGHAAMPEGTVNAISLIVNLFIGIALGANVVIANAIGCRDDIMLYLISRGMDAKLSFKIMESVRKGKVKRGGFQDGWVETMQEHGVPEWYITSLSKIAYLFPKAHAVAYVMMAFRIAWFKVHEPLAFYATFFTVRAKAFDAEYCCCLLYTSPSPRDRG